MTRNIVSDMMTESKGRYRDVTKGGKSWKTPITRPIIKVLLFENVQYNFMQNPKIEQRTN